MHARFHRFIPSGKADAEYCSREMGMFCLDLACRFGENPLQSQARSSALLALPVVRPTGVVNPTGSDQYSLTTDHLVEAMAY